MVDVDAEQGVAHGSNRGALKNPADMLRIAGRCMRSVYSGYYGCRLVIECVQVLNAKITSAEQSSIQMPSYHKQDGDLPHCRSISKGIPRLEGRARKAAGCREGTDAVGLSLLTHLQLTGVRLMNYSFLCLFVPSSTVLLRIFFLVVLLEICRKLCHERTIKYECKRSRQA